MAAEHGSHYAITRVNGNPPPEAIIVDSSDLSSHVREMLEGVGEPRSNSTVEMMRRRAQDPVAPLSKLCASLLDHGGVVPIGRAVEESGETEGRLRALGGTLTGVIEIRREVDGEEDFVFSPPIAEAMHNSPHQNADQSET